MLLARYETITEASADSWRDAVGHRLPCSPEWLTMLEANNFALARRYPLLNATSSKAPRRCWGICSYLADETVHGAFQPLLWSLRGGRADWPVSSWSCMTATLGAQGLMAGKKPDGPREFVYFNVGYYSMIDLAAKERVALIDYGVQAYEAKLYRGCRLQPLWCYVKVPSRHRDALEAAAAAHRQAMRARAGQWPPGTVGSME